MSTDQHTNMLRLATGHVEYGEEMYNNYNEPLNKQLLQYSKIPTPVQHQITISCSTRATNFSLCYSQMHGVVVQYVNNNAPC